jgi:GntR family transcriptional regulator
VVRVVPYDIGVSIDKWSREPFYRQLAAVLRAKFDANEIAIGEKLPSEGELEAGYDVGRNTVRAALQLLREEHRVETFPVRGTFRVS